MTDGVTGVAAFDFDGTLTRGDSLRGFLRRVAGDAAMAAALTRVPRVLARTRPERVGRDTVKAVLLAELLGGRSIDVVAQLAREYGTALAETVTPDMRAVLGRHRHLGHRLVVVSASLELYLEPAAELLGIDAVLGTRLVVDPDGILTGELAGANCRGPEKARRLAEWMDAEGLAGTPLPVWAYGNSAGDVELLGAASVATRVRRGRPPRRWDPPRSDPGPADPATGGTS